MEKIKGTMLDENGKKITVDNILDNPRLISIIKNGGEIVLPANRPDLIKYFNDMRFVNPNIKVTATGNIKAKYLKDKIRNQIGYAVAIKKFKKESEEEIERLNNHFRTIFESEKNLSYALSNFIYKISDDFINNYDLIIDILIKNLLKKFMTFKNMTIVLKKRHDTFFENLPTNEEIASVLTAELLYLYKEQSLKNVNVLDYILQQLPKDYTYKRTQEIIALCFHRFLILEKQGENGD